MINLFRQNQRIIMLVVAILTIIAFVWLYNPTTTHTNELGQNFVARIYGEKLTQADLDREARNYALAFRMQDIPLITGLTSGANGDEQQSIMEFVWNAQVLRHEAKALGIDPTPEQLTDATMKMSVFQTDEKFDAAKFNKFVSDQLPSLGFSPSQIDEIVRDSVRLSRVRDLVSAPATVSESEVREVSRIFEKLDFEIVKFDTKGIAEGVEVTPEESTEFFNRVKSNLFTPEKRSVEYVEFPLPKYEGTTPQTEADKLAAQQKTADLADEFARKAESGSFADLAKAGGLEIKSIAEFERNQASNGSPESAIITAIAPATFALTEAKPVSDVIDAGGDKFVVVRLGKTTPSRPMTIEEVKPQIEAQIRATKAEQKIAETANATIAKIREAIKSGQTFEQAVQAQGLTTEKFTGIVPNELTMQSPAAPYVRLTIPMEPSQLSGYSPSAEGGFAVYLQNRTPLTDAEFAERSKTVREQVLEQKRRLLFESWLQTARDNAGIAAGNQAAQ